MEYLIRIQTQEELIKNYDLNYYSDEKKRNRDYNKLLMYV